MSLTCWDVESHGPAATGRCCPALSLYWVTQRPLGNGVSVSRSSLDVWITVKERELNYEGVEGKSLASSLAISAVLVMAAPDLRVTLQFISVSSAMAECRKEETNCSLDSTGELSLLFACKTHGIVTLGKRLSWADLLQDLQILRMLLVSCMWPVEGTGVEKQPQPVPAGCPELPCPPASNLFEQSSGGERIVGWGLGGLRLCHRASRDGGESINTSLCLFQSKLPYKREMAQSCFHALPADLLCFRSEMLSGLETELLIVARNLWSICLRSG